MDRRVGTLKKKIEQERGDPDGSRYKGWWEVVFVEVNSKGPMEGNSDEHAQRDKGSIGDR